MADEDKDTKASADEKTADKNQSKTRDRSERADAASEAPQEGAKKKSGVRPLVLIISAVGSLAVFLAVFSYMMGVFDQAPPEPLESEAVEETVDDTDFPAAQGYHSEFGRAAAEVAASQDSGAVDTFAELSLLDQRRRELATEEARIADQQRELLALKQEVERLLSRQDAIADEKVLYMAKLLDGMKPDEMTGLVAELDNKMILKVLPKMKPQNASKLLAQLPAKRAAAITTALLESES